MPRDSRSTVVVSAGRLEGMIESFGWIIGSAPISWRNSFTASSKPKLNKEGTAYLYKDRNGKETWVSAGKVTEIAPE